MGEILGWYVFFLKWQFGSLWFYVWLFFLGVLAWRPGYYSKFTLTEIGAVVLTPIFLILLKWSELYSR